MRTAVASSAIQIKDSQIPATIEAVEAERTTELLVAYEIVTPLNNIFSKAKKVLNKSGTVYLQSPRESY